MKKKYSPFGFLIFVAVLSRAFATDELPKRADFSRYQAMLDHSPFAVATAATPPPVAPNFAKDLYIANAARSSEGDLVTLASSADKNFKKYLTTKEPVDGFSISNIEWSDKVGETKVTIGKDGQFATLTFNQALLSQTVANPALPQAAAPSAPIPMAQPNLPAPQAPTGGYVPPRPMPVPSLPTPLPRVRQIIQQHPAGTSGGRRPLSDEPPQ